MGGCLVRQPLHDSHVLFRLPSEWRSTGPDGQATDRAKVVADMFVRRMEQWQAVSSHASLDAQRGRRIS
jgi:hypothetical protein